MEPAEEDSDFPDHQLELSAKKLEPPVPRPATLFLINHNPPHAVDQAAISGADSVIEVFDTAIGSSEASYRTTIRHPLIYTPNNLVATGPNSFYVTNDHAQKVAWVSEVTDPLSVKSMCYVYVHVASPILCY